MSGFFFRRVLFSVLLVVGVLFSFMGDVSCGEGEAAKSQSESELDKSYRSLSLFGDVLELTRRHYVNEEDTDIAALISAAMDGMLSSLDPHSAYLDEEEFKELQDDIASQFGGLGIYVTMQDGVVQVISPLDETPAARSGLMPGDRITHLDGVSIFGMTLREAVKRMRGDPGSSIVLTIQRKGLSDLMKLRLVREIIVVQPVRHRIEGGDVGYIRITSFSEKTREALEEALLQISAGVDKMAFKGYILDLRRNPGGLLSQAIAVSDVFLDGGEVVSTRGREGQVVRRYNANAGVLVPEEVPVLVLIDGGSASASEIVAAALQDRKRALVLGTRSFGKGSVQNIMPLGGNGALRVTTARYYTPSGRSIQAKGVKPDIWVEQGLPVGLEDKLFLRQRVGESSVWGHLEPEETRDSEEEEGIQEGEEKEGGALGGGESGSSLAHIPLDPRRDVQLNYALDWLRREKGQDDGQGE